MAQTKRIAQALKACIKNGGKMRCSYQACAVDDHRNHNTTKQQEGYKIVPIFTADVSVLCAAGIARARMCVLRVHTRTHVPY
jgi:hypothetical protein